MNLTDLQVAVLRDLHERSTYHVDELVDAGEFPSHHSFAHVNTAFRKLPCGLYEENEAGQVRLTEAGLKVAGYGLGEVDQILAARSAEVDQ